jgi:diguanylate cyclase (GGDEF)-like protein
LSLAMIDVDNFKAVNDREGHSEGDHLLCQFARSWQEVVRDGGDFVARLGGDEFGVLASSTNEFGAQSLAQRLEEITVRGVSCSVGVVKWDGVESAGELVQRADEAMFHAKRLKGAA